MRIIISPAKRMWSDPDSLDCLGLPQFLPETERIYSRLSGMSPQELQKLWRCNDQIAKQNADRLKKMRLYENLTPAVLAYDGIQYKYMAPGVFTREEFSYLQEHLRILSGFYGLLRPFDGVTPYRLEMQAKLEVDGKKDLYDFWGEKLSEKLFSETPLIINLASREYSRCVTGHLPPDGQVITCVFAQRQGEKLVEKATLCKMARGEMVRYMAENQIKKPKQLQKFDRLGFVFSPEDSDPNTYIFIKEGK